MPKIRFRQILPIVLACWFIANQSIADAAINEVNKASYTMWLGHSKSRFPYESALARLALDKTIPQYGPYELNISTLSLTGQRGLRMVQEGLFHIIPSGDWPQEDQVFLHRVDISIWEGLLGYRKLMVHKSNLNQFAEIQNINDLRQYRAGQGTNWTDVLIYKANDIDVMTAISFPSMYGMLNVGRFDFLPLGANEMETHLSAAQQQYPDLTVAPGLLIHYPLNIYFQVGAQHSDLANRLEQGLKLAAGDGSWKALKKQYLEHSINELALQQSRVIQLHNRVTD